MKKILLFAFVAVATINASAIERMKKSPFPKNQKKALVSQKVNAGVLSNKPAYLLPQAQVLTSLKNVKFAKKAGEEQNPLMPAFSMGTYRYSSLIGGFAPQAIYEGASFYADKESGKAYLKPFDLIPGVVEGVFETKKNQYSELGYDSITFNCDDIFAQFEGDEVTQKLYFLPSDVEGSAQEGFAPVRTDKTTFGAYYISESDPEEGTYTNLYIDEVLAVYLNDETTPWNEFLVLVGLDMQPQEECLSYMSKAVVNSKNAYGETYDFTNEDAIVLFGSKGYYVQGVDNFDSDAWVFFEVDEEDESIFTVDDNQYIGVMSFYTDATRTSTYDVLITTVGVVWDGTKISGWAPNYTSSYKATDVDEVTVLKNTDNTLYADYGYAEIEDQSGSYDAAELTITILYEEIEVGVAGVKSNVPQNNVRYNVAGQRVDKNFKGIVIENGKKYLRK